MIDLSSLPKVVKRKKKRLGRGLGSGKGAKSGRGITRHQKAREKISSWFEGGQNPLIKKFPLLRGKGRNKPIKPKPLIVNLSLLNRLPVQSEVTIETLIKFNLIDEKVKKHEVKILSNGELKKPLIVKLPVSQAAKIKIEKAGGKVVAV